MTISSVDVVAKVQNTIVNPVKAKLVSWKEYLGQLADRFKSHLPNVPKVAKVFGETLPTRDTPSEENVSVANPSAVAPLTSLQKIRALILDEKNTSLTARVMRAVSSAISLEETELKWQNTFHEGGTGYIDGVKPADLSHSVMWGIDSWDRPFVALKLREANGVGEPGVETLFQRYIEEENIWASGKHYLQLPKHAKLVDTRMGSAEFAAFSKLIKGEAVDLQGFNGEDVSAKLAG